MYEKIENEMKKKEDLEIEELMRYKKKEN